MSDLPNGTPPGQNNLDATAERYVPLANDPSATAQKPDELRAKEDGIEVRDETDPKVQQELDQASKTVVGPSTAEEQEEEQPKPAPKPAVQPAPKK